MYVVTVPGMDNRQFSNIDEYLRFYHSLDEDQRRLFRVYTQVYTGSDPVRAAFVKPKARGTFAKPGRPPVYDVTPEQVAELAQKRGCGLAWARELLRRAAKGVKTRPVGRPKKIVLAI